MRLATNHLVLVGMLVFMVGLVEASDLPDDSLAHCKDYDLALQVLGSGGPAPDDNRASSGYLIWHKGKAVVLIEAGGGVFTQFGAAGANLNDLELIALTHFHTDHSADLPALMKGTYFSQRRRALTISGPSGAGAFPSLDQFLFRMFDKKQGAYGYLWGLLEDDHSLPELIPVVVDHNSTEPQPVFDNLWMSVQAVGTDHGPVPAVSYLVTIGGTRIAVSSDQNLSTDYFVDMIKGADIFVMPMVVHQTERPIKLHAKPSEIGVAAAKVEPLRLLLSHWMERTLKEQKKNLELVAEHYSGEVIVAEDLLCIDLSKPSNAKAPKTED